MFAKYNDVKGMKEESGGKKVERLLCERENLVIGSLIYLEPVDFRIGVM